jgi:DNA-binding transcriptional LysR family regulator
MGQLEDMAMFVRIVDAGGIGKAAEQLSLAKSAVSRRLVELEKRLNTKLLIRTTRKSSLTDAGRHYYQRAINIIDDVAQLNTNTSNTNIVLEGSLRLALPLSFGLMHLSPILDEFKRQHPQLRLEIDFSDRQINLVEEGFELAVRIGELKDSSMQAKKIAVIQHMLCASPDYLVKHGEPNNVDELKHHQLLRYVNNEKTSWSITDPKGKKYTLEANAQISANNGVFLKKMAIAGHGIVYIPCFIAYQAIAEQSLVPVLQDHQFIEYNMYAVYPQNRFLSQRSRSFIELLTKSFSLPAHWNLAL